MLGLPMVQIPEDDGWCSRHLAPSSATLGAPPPAPQDPRCRPTALHWGNGMCFPSSLPNIPLGWGYMSPCSWETSQKPPGPWARDVVLCWHNLALAPLQISVVFLSVSLSIHQQPGRAEPCPGALQRWLRFVLCIRGTRQAP